MVVEHDGLIRYSAKNLNQFLKLKDLQTEILYYRGTSKIALIDLFNRFAAWAVVSSCCGNVLVNS